MWGGGGLPSFPPAVLKRSKCVFSPRLGSVRFVYVPFVDVCAQSVLGNVNGRGTVEAVGMSGLRLVSFLHTSCVFGVYYLTSRSHGERAVLPVLLGPE